MNRQTLFLSTNYPVYLYSKTESFSTLSFSFGLADEDIIVGCECPRYFKYQEVCNDT